MTGTGSYDVRTAHQDLDAELGRLAAQARLGWVKEAAALERFGFRDGMSILELGSGPGFLTELLLDRFSTAELTCVERDAGLIDTAREYLAAHGERVTFVNASAESSGLPADSYDAAYARLLFQHLPDPAAAAAEIFRILRPGAPLVIYDIDDELAFVTDPVIPGLDAVMERMGQLQAAQGGNRYIGRRLIRILKAAGFDQLDVDAISTNSDVEGIEPFLHQFDPGRLSPLISMGVVSQVEADELIGQRADFLAGDPIILFVALMAGGRKPAGAAGT